MSEETETSMNLKYARYLKIFIKTEAQQEIHKHICKYLN